MTSRRAGVFVAALIALTLWGCSSEPAGFSRVVLEQWARYPRMEAQDLYKLAFQAALGNEHMMTDTVMARRYLLQELESVEASRLEPLLEPINGDGSLVRVNLRPFKAARLDPGALVAAMIHTGLTFSPSEQLLESHLEEIRLLSLRQKIDVPLGELLPFFEHQRASSFPAVHHSERYARHYRPAYRVVLRASLPASLAR